MLRILALCVVVSLGLVASVEAQSPEAPLQYWQVDSPARMAIIDFVERVGESGALDEGPPPLAVFDMDGTLAIEKPSYQEIILAAEALCEQARQDPPLLKEPMYKAACDKDYATLDTMNWDQNAVVLLTAFLGKSPEQFDQAVNNFLGTFNAKFEKPMNSMVYLPMVELMNYLSSKGFRIAIVSDSQQDFIRGVVRNYSPSGPVCDGTPHICKEIPVVPARSFGTVVELIFHDGVEGQAFVRADAMRGPSVDGVGKPVTIWEAMGTQPVLAFGNTMGDYQMLRYATSGPKLGMGLILNHDDSKREYKYVAPKILAAVKANGWTAVSMKNDFKYIFAWEKVH